MDNVEVFSIIHQEVEGNIPIVVVGAHADDLHVVQVFRTCDFGEREDGEQAQGNEDDSESQSFHGICSLLTFGVYITRGIQGRQK